VENENRRNKSFPLRREAGHHVRTLLIEKKKIKTSHRKDLSSLKWEFTILSYLGAFMGLTPLCRMSRLGFSFCETLEEGTFPLPREEYQLLGRLIEGIVNLLRFLEESKDDGLYITSKESVLTEETSHYDISEIERLFKKRLITGECLWEVKSLSIGKDNDFSHALRIPKKYLDPTDKGEGKILYYLDLNQQDNLIKVIEILEDLSSKNQLPLLGHLDLPYDSYRDDYDRLPIYFLYSGPAVGKQFLEKRGLNGHILKVLKVPIPKEKPLPVPDQTKQEKPREIIREVPFLPPELMEKIDLIAEQTHGEDLPEELDLKKPKSRKLGVRFSIGFKLILIISTVIILAMSTMSFISFSLFKNTLSREIEQNSLTVADLLSINTKNSFNNLRDSLRVLLNNNRDIDSLEETLINDYPYILYFELISSDIEFSYPGFFSYEYIRSILEENYDDLLEVAWQGDQNFRRTFNPSFFLTDTRNTDPVTGVILTYWDEKDNRLKPLIIIVKTAELLDDIINSTGSRTIFVLNGQGELIGHPEQSLVTSSLPGEFDNHPILRHVRESGSTANQQISYKQTIFPESLSEEMRTPDTMLGAFTNIAQWDLFFVSEVKEAAVFNPINDILRQNIYLMIMILSLAILLIYFFSKTITMPLARLMVATKMIEKGMYELKLKVRNRDETGVLTQAFVDMGLGLQERERMKDAFGRFVNKEVAKMAAKGELHLGGETKDATIFFSDIRSFTAISEKLEPNEVVEFLNEYMTEMVRCVNDNLGHVDKYIGDAIMGLWGVPKSHGNDPEHCINCSLAMREALIRFNKGRGGDKRPIIKIGCGINSGPVVSGQIGSEDRMEYTVIGDAVNLAARIEPLNKPMGTDILISTDTFNQVKGIYDVVPMNKIMVKGKSDAQQIYAVLGRLDDPNRPKNLDEMRTYVGIEGDFSDVLNKNVDEKEVKYEIMD
jgi:adenylate cyclase